MTRRGITEEIITLVIKNPDQIIDCGNDRSIYQKKITMDAQTKIYLFRVFLDIKKVPVEVVTVYKTSRIEKYWEERS